MMFLKNVKARTLWILTGVIFAVLIGIVVALPYIPKDYTTVIIIFMVIGFISLTILIQWASFKSFKYKPKKEKAIAKEFITNSNLEDLLLKNKYKARTRSYGISYLKIDRPNAFKVTLVTNAERYFNPIEEDNVSGDKNLDKCDRMVAFEIFLDYKEEDIEKIKEYSIQGKNIYYTAFYKVNDSYICPNYKEPAEVHIVNYNRLIKELELTEKIEENEA